MWLKQHARTTNRKKGKQNNAKHESEWATIKILIRKRTINKQSIHIVCAAAYAHQKTKHYELNDYVMVSLKIQCVYQLLQLFYILRMDLR